MDILSTYDDLILSIMFKLLFGLALLIFPLLGFTQKDFALLGTKLKQADSVFIISYNPCLNLCGFSYQLDMKDSSHIEMKFHKVVERVRIQDTALQSLRKILVTPVRTVALQQKCLTPNHGILIYSGKEELYLDLSFKCKQYTGSLELKPYDEIFDDEKWKALFDFFYQKGIRFQMGDSTESEEVYEEYIKRQNIQYKSQIKKDP